MLRTALNSRQKAAPSSWKLLVFSVGGRRLAVKTDEVAGISQWKDSAAVPSQTPFVSSVIRNNETLLPVFDLAGLLRVSIRGADPLCLTAKHPRGPMAICIDGEMPVLQTLDPASIRPCQGEAFDSLGSFASGLEEVPIIALSKLGSSDPA
ncbi:MAG: chemotaxis protein CheW [Nitrospiraceae bacterium]